MNKRITALVGAVLIAMVVALGVVVAVQLNDDGGGASQSTAVATATTTSSQVRTNDSAPSNGDLTAGADFSHLYEEVRASVVRIITGDVQDPFAQRPEGLGSGIVLDEEGHILTNYHVVQGSNTVTVTFSDGTVAKARVSGRDPGNDTAVIQVQGVDPAVLVPARLGDSSAVKVGSLVAAIGNPFGLDGTLTTGIISGVNRTLPSQLGRSIRGLIQTDAAVNPGNSGGALFNVQGEVIGINTAIENPGGTGFAGIAYAVPINTPKRFMSQLTSGATIEHPRLGISGRALSPSDADDLGVPQGVAVLSVDGGGAAAVAGLRESANGKGDIVVAIDGQPMKTFEALADYIDSKNVGDEVTLSVRRDRQDLELKATLRAWDSTA